MRGMAICYMLAFVILVASEAFIFRAHLVRPIDLRKRLPAAVTRNKKTPRMLRYAIYGRGRFK